MAKPPPACLTIAGSDPSGGAGIQADLKTFAALKVYGCAAITCLTAQNSRGVSSFQTVAGDFIREQIDLVLDDLPITHIKIGMVGSPEAAAAIAAALAGFKGQIIFDPVLRASDGTSLMTQGFLAQLLTVVSLATVITPNLPELRILTGHPCADSTEIIRQAGRLLTTFPALQAIVVTGGHLHPQAEEITDFLLVKTEDATAPTVETATHPRVQTSNTHGTGCTFASAFTAYHLQRNDYREAFFHTVDFMDRLLRSSASYRGGMQHHLL